MVYPFESAAYNTPIHQVSKIRRNKNDIFFDKICKLEGIKDSIKKALNKDCPPSFMNGGS